MAAVPIQYKRLPGTGYRREGNALITVRRSMSRMWLGPDHVLCAERTWWTEGYKRFDYRDIQAIIVRRTKSWSNTNWIIGVSAIICLVIALLCGPIGRWLWGTIVLALGIIVIINSLLGPSCKVHLKTAVQLEELPIWPRVKKADRGIEQLRQRIVESQGGLGTAEVRERVEALQNQPGGTQTGTRAVGILKGEIKPYEGRVHLIMFWAAVIEGLMLLLRIPFNSLTMVILSGSAMLVSAGSVVWALIRQYETDLRDGLRQLTWAVAIVTGLELIEGYIYLLVTAITHPLIAGNQWLIWKHLGEVNPLKEVWAMVVLLIFGIAKAGLGATGLLMKPRPAMRTPQPLQPPLMPPPV